MVSEVLLGSLVITGELGGGLKIVVGMGRGYGEGHGGGHCEGTVNGVSIC